MKREIKEAWLRALKSGEYEQGELHLEKDLKYCCLGVLCKVLNQDPKEETVVTGAELLSKATLSEIGLSHTEQETLSKMNDGGYFNGMKLAKHNFIEIANYIEYNIKGEV